MGVRTIRVSDEFFRILIEQKKILDSKGIILSYPKVTLLMAKRMKPLELQGLEINFRRKKIK